MAPAQAVEAGRGGEAVEEGGDGRGVGILLVAVEGDLVGVEPVEDGGDAGQAGDVGLGVAGDLQLEEAVAVGGDRLLQRLGEAVVQAVGGGEVGGGQRVGEADGVADGDARRPVRRPARKPSRSKPARSGAVAAVRPMRLAADELGGRGVLGAGEGVEHRALDEREAVGGDERRQVLGGAGGVVVGLDGGDQTEGRAAAGGEDGLGGEVERAAELGRRCPRA